MNSNKNSNNCTFSPATHKLVIDAKPSVAHSLTAVPGANEKTDTCKAMGIWLAGIPDFYNL